MSRGLPMWSEEKIKEYLKLNLKESRYNHVLGVTDTAERLAKLYGADPFKARMAALIHDCAKNMSDEDIIKTIKNSSYKVSEEEFLVPQLLHGLAGAIIGKNIMGIEDEDILNAAIYHTTGKVDMSILEKIVYIADYIEPSRNFPGVEELRRVTFEDLDRGVLMAFDNTIRFVISKGEVLHKDTVEARNYLLAHINNK